MSGFAFVGTGVGGFWTVDGLERASRAFESYDSSIYLADVDPELFVRLAQFGSLSGLTRFHGVGAREPWAYPAPYGALAV
jgi:alpha-D-xyloside xylohydrolase